jgi:predicted Zn-dependent protease
VVLLIPLFGRALQPNIPTTQACPTSETRMRPRPLVATMWIVLLSPAGTMAAAQDGSTPPVLAAMQEELTRSLTTLESKPAPPYFLSYEIRDAQSMEVDGAYGAVTAGRENHRRLLTLDLRVGTPVFDNTHPTRGFDLGMIDRHSRVEVPIEDNATAIRHALWQETDRTYKRAIERLTRVKADASVRAALEDSSSDFSNEPAVQHVEPAKPIVFDRAMWERKIKAYTAPFAHEWDIYDGDARVSVEGETRWYVNSDGSRLQTTNAYYRLLISAYTKAADGMVLPRYESYVATSPAGLPDDSTVAHAVARMIADLHALKTAPVLDAYTGPAILSGRASGVFFHEVFGHRIEGHRQKNEEDAQTFKKKVGDKILPDGFTVYFDPTQRRIGTTDLAGYYLYDDEGVQARRVDVVKNGVFANFLLSRSPIAGFDHSNGHGRSQPGFGVVARQSNLVVTSAQPVSRDELKRMLVQLIVDQHKPFGLLFDDIEGGFTMTERSIPNAFNVIPVMVYRVYPDGKEELIRGVDLIGTPLTVFSKVVAADADLQVFNGVCGAESGWIPVSASSPDLLLSQIEVQKKAKSQEQLPILPPPGGVVQ